MKKLLSILALLLTMVQGVWADLTISTASEWNTFATNVKNGTTYSGQTVYLNANISVATMVGSSLKPFSGTFDGRGNTLTVNMTGTSDDTYTAPFAALSGATIQNLNVTGSITTGGKRPASIASFVTGNSTITNCKSSVAITSSYNINKDVDAGGFVARVDASKSLTVTGCTFAGSITYTYPYACEGGGFVGWLQDGATANITNCVFAPSETKIPNWELPFKMFAGGVSSSTVNIDNCYYNRWDENVDEQGKQMRSISAGNDVTSLAISGDATATYNVSDITVYSKGFKYNSAYYASDGDVVPLTLSHADRPGYPFIWYTVKGGGSLSAQTETSATLKMADANQAINILWTTRRDVTWDDADAEKSNWSIAPANPVTAGAAVTATYDGKRHVKSVKWRPAAIIGGKFSINNGDKVYFSRGNLQATTTNLGNTWTWGFAAHQWDFVGNAPANNAIDYEDNITANGTVDLFGWSSVENYLGICVNGSRFGGDFVNWASHEDVVAGIGPGWHTPSIGEWIFILNGRDASTVAGTANARYAKAKVNNVYGVILFPDSYTHPDGVANPFGINEEGNTGWWNNSYGAEDWAKMEAAGCVFLPAAGGRSGDVVINTGEAGACWSTTGKTYEYNAFNINFYSEVLTDIQGSKNSGHSVRLVFPAE